MDGHALPVGFTRLALPRAQRFRSEHEEVQWLNSERDGRPSKLTRGRCVLDKPLETTATGSVGSRGEIPQSALLLQWGGFAGHIRILSIVTTSDRSITAKDRNAVPGLPARALRHDCRNARSGAR